VVGYVVSVLPLVYDVGVISLRVIVDCVSVEDAVRVESLTDGKNIISKLIKLEC